MAGRTLAMLLAVYAMNFMDRQLLAILIEPIRKELAFSDAAAGLLYGFTFVLFYTVLGVPIARAADRSNRSRIITWSLALFSVMTAVCAWAGSYWHLLLVRMGVGIGEAGTGPASQSIIADLYPIERRSFAMAVFATGPHLGVLLGFLVGGFVGEAFGWRAPFLVAGIAGLALAALCGYLLKEPERTGIRIGAGSAVEVSLLDAARTVWRQPSLRHLFIGCALADIAISGLIAWMPAFLMRAHELKLSTTGALLAFVLGALGAGGTLFGGWMADRFGSRRPSWGLKAPAVVMMLAAPVWAMAIAAHSNVAALIALALAGAFIAVHVGPAFAMVQTLAASHIRAVTASLLLFVANLVGVGVGPYLVGALSDAALSVHGTAALRLGLMIAPPLFLWAAAHFMIAAKALSADLRTASAIDAAPADLLHAASANDAGAHFR